MGFLRILVHGENILDFETKKVVFYRFMKQRYSQCIYFSIFLDCIIAPYHVNLTIDRSQLLRDSMQEVMKIPGPRLRSPFFVSVLFRYYL